MVARDGIGLFAMLKARNLLILGRHHAHGTHQAPYPWYTVGTRAERRAGEILKDLELRGGDRKSKSHDVTLKDFDISKMQSHRWQAVAYPNRLSPCR